MKYHYSHNYKTSRGAKRKKAVIGLLLSRGFWLSILAVSIVSGLGYLLFFSGFFRVGSITMAGCEQTEAADIIRVAEEKAGNIFLLDKAAIVSSILSAFPKLEAVKVKRVFPNKLSIEAVKRAEAITVCPPDATGGDCFGADKNGVIFGKTANSGLPVVRTQKAVEIGKIAMPAEIVEAILKLGEEMKRGDIKINEYAPLSDNGGVVLKSDEGWEAKMSLDKDAAGSAKDLKIVLAEKIPQAKRASLEYIDLRFSGQVFYKYRGSEPAKSEEATLPQAASAGSPEAITAPIAPSQ